MSQSEEPKPPDDSARKRTPRVPSNVLYDRIVPIVLIIIAIVLFIVLAAVVLGVGQTY